MSATHPSFRSSTTNIISGSGNKEQSGLAYTLTNLKDPWIELDLGSTQQVYEVQVYDRADLPKSSTLGIFEVALASTPFPASDKVACRKGFAHSQLGTEDTPISLRCYGFARYVVVTLLGTGRQIALREIDVFVIEKFDGTACPNEFKAPPEPPPFPPATPPPPAAGS